MVPHSKPTITDQDIEAVVATLRSGQLSQGIQVQQFEEKIANFLGVKGAVATSSGTAALHLALLAIDIKPGDEIILPSYVCASLLQAVHYVSAKPVFVEINAASYNLDIDDLRKRISAKTRAIIVTHNFGLPAEIDKIIVPEIAIIEDCAQSIGAYYKNKPVGSFGDLAIFSFYATKLITTGEGGMVVSNSDSLLAKIRDLREYDEKPDFTIRYNYKMSDMEAALGISQFEQMPQFIKKRIQLAEIYNSELNDLSLHLPIFHKSDGHIYFRYIIQNQKGADQLLKLLLKHGIESRRPIYKPLHQVLQQSGYLKTDEVARKAISLPIYPSLTEQQQQQVIDTLKQVIA